MVRAKLARPSSQLTGDVDPDRTVAHATRRFGADQSLVCRLGPVCHFRDYARANRKSTIVFALVCALCGTLVHLHCVAVAFRRNDPRSNVESEGRAVGAVAVQRSIPDRYVAGSLV